MFEESRLPAVPPAAAPGLTAPSVDASAAGPAAAATCPWCSAAIASPDVESCPACGARLIESAGAEIPGVTTIDPAVLRALAAPAPKRGGLRLGGAAGLDPSMAPEAGVAPSSLDALAPPSAEVLVEMRRLREELDAAAAAEAAATAEVKARAAAAEADARAAAAQAAAAEAAAGGEPHGPADVTTDENAKSGRS